MVKVVTYRNIWYGVVKLGGISKVVYIAIYEWE